MNHDPRLLLDGPYPFSLKQRIRGDRGHLSNQQGAQLLAEVMHGGLQQVTLAHLSEHNNTESHARRAADAVLVKYGSRARLCVASQARPLEPVLLSPRAAEPLRRARQLALFA
jgi:phosphoribosyl 1,2-cyclic phosphodiesterase